LRHSFTVPSENRRFFFRWIDDAQPLRDDAAMRFDKRKMEDRHRQAAEKEAAGDAR
jgi:hypothetical protein